MEKLETTTVVDIETLVKKANADRERAVGRLIGAWSSIDSKKISTTKREFRSWFNKWKT